MAIIIHAFLSLHSSQNSKALLWWLKRKNKIDYFKPLCKRDCSLCSTVSSAMSTMASSNSAGSAVILGFICKFMQRVSASLACVVLLKHHKALLPTWCGKGKRDSLCFTQQGESLQSACKQARDPWSIIIFKVGRAGNLAATKFCHLLWLFSMELRLFRTQGGALYGSPYGLKG